MKQTDAVNEVGLENVDEILSSRISTVLEQMSSCGDNYPALNKHILNWLDAFKQTKIYCTNEHSSDNLRLAYASPDHVPAFMDKKLFLHLIVFYTFFRTCS